MRKDKPKKCKNCGELFKPRYRTTERFCSYKCQTEDLKDKPVAKRTPIKPFSKKRLAEMPKYKKKRLEFLSKPENQICFIDGCTNRAKTVEHTRGRKGYADDAARDAGITLYLDERFWKPCCLHHNQELENNPELSKAYQLSKLTGKKKQ